MKPEIENALRAVARRCRDEIISARKGHPASEHDQITTPIVNKHAATITALPPGKFSAKLWLCYFVRVVDSEARS
ncbi:hypothetical protein ACLEEJ_00465 [Lonsdalea quercina]|uniref:hypothetical protein n=1 Tax=Lonsdalea quercina TaxID=71657 RepID=UPI003975F327